MAVTYFISSQQRRKSSSIPKISLMSKLKTLLRFIIQKIQTVGYCCRFILLKMKLCIKSKVNYNQDSLRFFNNYDIIFSDAISIDQSIVSMFQLQIFMGVRVTVIDPQSAALDSLELTFKDQYLGRSDMWRLKNSLIGSCVYTNKKIEFCHKSVRCQVLIKNLIYQCFISFQIIKLC